MHKQDLNTGQQEAVLHGRGPAMVLAGPGSGKTFVLTKRIQNLILNHHINPGNILTITFTKAAALEMKKRAIHMEKQAEQVVFGTFHSIFFQILRTSSRYSGFTILTEGEKKHILKEILYHHKEVEEEEMDSLVSKLLKEFPEIKKEEAENGQIENEQMRNGGLSVEFIKQVYEEYERELILKRKMDFDGILYLCRDYLQNNPEVLQAWQKRFLFLLIDEFQDINQVQYDIIRLLAWKNQNIFIVGDDDQSIYGFRGSKPDFMRKFLTDFPKANRILLNTNYRSKREIVQLASKSISHNKNRFPKEIVSGFENEKKESKKQQENPVQIKIWKEEKEEEEFLIREILKSPYPLEEIAVLFRTNKKAQCFLEKLYKHKIPCFMKEKAVNFYEYPIVQDILAYLKFAHLEQRRAYFYRFMNKPVRYIKREAVTGQWVDFESLYQIYSGKKQMLFTLKKLKRDISFLKSLDPYSGICYILKAIGYETYMHTMTEGNLEKWKEWEELAEELKIRAKEFTSCKEFLLFIEMYSLHFKETARQKNEGKEKEKGVQLMTYHGSKGLEFKEVYLPYLVGGTVPYHKAVTEEQVEEERRMFYVAMTRAEEKLYMTATENSSSKKSVFLEELECEN